MRVALFVFAFSTVLFAPVGIKPTIVLPSVQLHLEVDGISQILEGIYLGTLQRGGGRRASYHIVVRCPERDKTYDVEISKLEYEAYFQLTQKLKGVEAFTIHATGAGISPRMTKSIVTIKVGADSYDVPTAALKDGGECFIKTVKVARSQPQGSGS